MRKVRIALFGEAVSLAHVTRPAALATTLDPDRYETYLVSDPKYRDLAGSLDGFCSAWSMGPEAFLGRVAKGKPIFCEEVLGRYLEDDRRVLAELEPDIVVGDFRVSLSISARMQGIPYVAIADSYWSQHTSLAFPAPDLSIADRIGAPAARLLLRVAQPLVFALHTRAINRARASGGLPRVGNDLRRAYSDADYVAYADIPGLTPMNPLPPTHQYLGPVLWSPKVALPPWWSAVSENVPCVYVCMGSSGAAELVPSILAALSDLPIQVIVATAGRVDTGSLPKDARVAEFLPGDAAAARSQLVICNGGSPSTHQALAQGVPVLGIASNLDQLLNMEGIRRQGVGRLVRGREATGARIRKEVVAMLGNASFRRAARRIKSIFDAHNPSERFPMLIDAISGYRSRMVVSVPPPPLSIDEPMGPAARLGNRGSSALVDNALRRVSNS